VNEKYLCGLLLLTKREGIRMTSGSGTPRYSRNVGDVAICPMSPIGPGVCTPGISVASQEWMADMISHADRISLSESVKEVVIMAVPNMLAFVASFAVNMITFACLSAQDDPKLLGAVGLGSLIGNIFGFSIGIGLTSVLDTLVSQSVGAGNHKLSVIHLNRARFISAIVTIPCFYLMWVTEPLLIILKQDPETSALAAKFVQGTCWGLLPYFFCNALNSYMRCYGKTLPPVIINIVSSIFHLGITLLAVNRWSMGAYGAGLCISITYYFRWMLTEGAMWFYKETRAALKWTSASIQSSGVKRYIVLAVNNSALLIFEWAAYELQALIAGWVGTEGLAAHVAGANVVTAVFMGAIGISQSAATLVGISLGNEKPKTAKSFAIISLSFTACLYTIVGMCIIAFRERIALVISSDAHVVETLNVLLIAVGVFAIFDAINGVGEGVLRGMGLQQKAVVFKLTSMFGVRLPVGFILSLYIGVTGIWIGAIAGMLCSCSGFAWVVSRANFRECSKLAIQRQEEEKLTNERGLLEPLNPPDSPFIVSS
jgi:MATE family multidrug resistance protein